MASAQTAVIPDGGNPRFSVMIPAYNAIETLAESVESVIGQTFTDWELVIVDDGSTDDTLAVARGFESQDARIRVITQPNRGTGGAYNTAVTVARSDILVTLAADDLLLPEHLERLDEFISHHPEADIFSCDGYCEYEDGRRVPQRQNRGWELAPGGEFVDLLEACFFGVGAAFRRDVYERVGGYREDIYAEDYLFWLMALANGFTHRYLPVPLAVHKVTSKQKSGNDIKMRDSVVAILPIVMRSGLLGRHELNATRKRLVKAILVSVVTRVGLLMWIRFKLRRT